MYWRKIQLVDLFFPGNYDVDSKEVHLNDEDGENTIVDVTPWFPMTGHHLKKGLMFMKV